MDEACQEVTTVNREHDVSVGRNGAALAQNLQITGGNLSSAGRDYNVHNHTHHHTHNRNDEAPKIDLLAELKPIDNFRNIQQDTLSKRTEKTGEWIFDYGQFPVWRDPNSDVKMIWGSGIAGAGKTVLTSIVINYFETLSKQRDSHICVCYIYIRYSDNANLTVRHCLEVLVKQTIEKHSECHSIAAEVYAEHIHLGTRPTERELLQLLNQFTTVVEACFYFLDAIDEAPTQIQVDLLRALSTLNVKLFITSRPTLKALQEEFPEARRFDITAHDEDIELHISKEIDHNVNLRKISHEMGPMWQEEIMTTVKDKCGGMFLHAALQMADLQECTSIHDVRQTLSRFPDQIDKVYNYTCQRITEQSGNRAAQARTSLLWVLGAARSMKVEELRYAVATSLETLKFNPSRLVPIDLLVSSTRGLLVVDEETELVRLVHYTSKDTLNRLMLETTPHLQSLLTSFCIARLIEHGFQRSTIPERNFNHPTTALDRAFEGDPLLSYAYHSWSIHARNALKDPTTFTTVKNFVRGCQAFPVVGLYNRLELLGPLHLVAFFDLPTSLAYSKQARIFGPNPQTSFHETPLHLACRRSSLLTAKDLVSLGRINVNAQRQHGATPLALASQLGDEAIVQLLLAHPKIQIHLADQNSQTPLHTASLHGREGTVELLLAASQAGPHLRDSIGHTPLSLAAKRGRSSVVKLLIAASQSELHQVDYSGRTPLGHASEDGHEDVVKLLLAESEAEIHLPDKNGYTPLSRASENGHEGVVELLLAVSQAEVHLCDKYGKTPLASASENGHEGVVKLLLAASQSEIHLCDNHGRTPLSLASGPVKIKHLQSKRHLGTVKLLLHCSDAELNVADKDGYTPLIWAVRYSRYGADVVEYLLDYPGTDVNLVDKRGRTALYWAVEEGYSPVVELLLTHREVDVNLANAEGRTPLRWALEERHQNIVDLLLAHPKIINTGEVIQRF